MSDISSIKIGDTIYNIKDNVARSAVGLEFPIVYGTQTASTGDWTGIAPFNQLSDGQKILYFLPFAGSGNATLNLTLVDGETTTGAKNVYYSATTRMATHYGAGNFIPLIYRVDLQWGTNTTKYTGWWAFSDRTTDTANQIQVGNLKLKAGTNGIIGTTLVMRTGDGLYESIVTSRTTATTKTKNTSGFYLDEIFYYNSSTTITSGNTTGTYTLYKQLHSLDFRYSSNCGTTLVSYKPVYLVGTISSGLFYLDDIWWTQTLPTTQDNKIYIYIGEAYNNNAVCFSLNHHILHYVNGYIEPYMNFNNVVANFRNRDRDKLRTDGSVHNQLEVLWGTDFNDLTSTGFYIIRGNTNFPTVNAPPDFSNTDNVMYVWSMMYTADFIKQVALSVRNSNDIYVRTKTSGTWNPWSIIRTINNDESGTFTLQSESGNYHSIEQLTASYQLINNKFVYINASFKITATNSDPTYGIKLSGLPFVRSTNISNHTLLNIRADKNNTSAIYGLDCILDGDNCIYIYSKTNDGHVSTSVPCLVNDKFYINGTYAIG